MLLLPAVLLTLTLTLTGCAATAGSSPGGGAGFGMAGPGPMGTGMMDSGTGGRASASCAEPAAAGTVRVQLTDMGMSGDGATASRGMVMGLGVAPAVIAHGPVTLVAENLGYRVHEMVVLPLAAGELVGARIPDAEGKVDETGSLGEASAACAADTGDGIPAGSAGWTTVTLAPGRYELLCALENHYADGMFGELTVT
ncbi:MAG: hypothetical protein ABJA16_09020 [Nakamurella sp.]